MAKTIDTARDLSLIFCGALGAYLVSLVVMAKVSVPLLSVARSTDAAWIKVALGMVALDLGKVPGLLLAGWLLARATRLAPLASALGLVLLVYAFDVLISAMLQQAGWLWAEPLVLVCRLAAVACIVVLLTALVRRLRRPPKPAPEK